MVMIAIVACINTNNIEKYEKINTIINNFFGDMKIKYLLDKEEYTFYKLFFMLYF